MNIPRFSVRFPVTVAMIMMTIVILGIISFDRLGTDLLPAIYNPRVVVEVTSGQRSPQDMESRFARQLEGSLATVSHVVDVRSVSSVGRTQVTITFTWGTDMDFALLDVQKKVTSFESDPDVDQVSVARYDPQEEAIMIYALSETGSGERDLDELRRISESVVKRDLERLDGVARVFVYGGIKREVRVELDEYLLKAYGLSSSIVKDKIRQSNTDASGGKLVEMEKAYLIKGIGKYAAVEEVAATVIGYKSSQAGNGDSTAAGLLEAGADYSQDKAPIFLSDVAKVAYAPEERSDIVRLNGQETIGLYIFKESRENTVRVSNEVQDAVSGMERELQGLQFTQIYSQSSFIEKAIGEVETTAIVGIILAVLVLYAFLRNMSATVIVSLAIPISILATFTLMYFQRLTLNIMTLGGLALGAGMLVDNAIVVIENIFRRRQIGDRADAAAISGASEVGIAIVASTSTTIIVFLPIVYVQGVAAELFREQAWVVAFSLLSSLLVAFLLIPAIASRLFRNKKTILQSSRIRIPIYERALAWALGHKAMVVVLSVSLLIISIALLPMVGTEFIPRSSENQLLIDVELPTGTPLEKTSTVMGSIEEIIEQILGPDMENHFSTINVRSRQTLFLNALQQSEHRATITLNLARGRNSITPDGAAELLRPVLEDLPGITASFRIRESSLQQTIGTDSAPIVLEVRGDDIQTLQESARLLAGALTAAESLNNIETGFEEGRPELRLRVDRRLAANFGLDVQQIGATIRERLSGEVITDFYSEGNDRDIRVAFPVANRSELENFELQTSTKAVLRLKDVVDFIPGEGPKEITRHSQSRVALVSAGINPGFSLSEVINEIDPIIAAVPLVPGYEVRYSGEEASRQESFVQLRFALLLSIVLVYMVLASLFESFLHPFTILLTLPLAGVGVVFSFLAIGEPLSIMAFIGVIMLAGIAANDSIVLVDYVNRLRASGTTRYDALIQAGKDRLRPILMTSVTTILALLPLTIGIGEGAQLRAPMAVAVIGGLISSTLLTLIVIPVVYDLIDRVKKSRNSQKLSGV